MSSTSQRYAVVPGDDENGSERKSLESEDPLSSAISRSLGRRRTPHTTTILSIIQTALLLVLLVLVSISLSIRPSPTPAAPTSVKCGNTSTSAKEAGCVFDPLGYNWVPPQCYDSATASEFRTFLHTPTLRFGAFPFFRSNDTSDRVASEEELSQRVGMKTYTTQEEHLAHCVFMLRRLERAREGKFRWDGKGGYAHIEHCSHQVLERVIEGENPLDRQALHSVILMGVVSEC